MIKYCQNNTVFADNMTKTGTNNGGVLRGIPLI